LVVLAQLNQQLRVVKVAAQVPTLPLQLPLINTSTSLCLRIQLAKLQ
jgi:hypothetical protein